MRLPAGRVAVSGRLVGDPQGVVTIEPRQRHDQLPASSTGAIEARSRTHLRLTDIDNASVAALPGARRDAGRVQAWADLAGEIAEDGTVHVQRYGPLTALTDFWAPGPAVRLDADIAPGRADQPLDLSPLPDTEQRLITDGVIVSRKIMRIRRGGRVLVIATTAPDEAEHRLRPIYATNLHIHASSWTSQHYRAATDALNDHYDQWRLLVVGDHTNAHGQVVIVAHTVDEHPELIAWAAGQPGGLVDHRPWVRRLSARHDPASW